MKILFAPAHFVFENNKYGSEFQQAFNVINPICQTNSKSMVITGYKDRELKVNYRIMEVQPNTIIRDSSFISSMLFSIKYSIAIAKVIKREKFEVLHHVRPFQINRTFNLAVLANLHKNTPFVIGSFCTPYKSELDNKRFSIINKILRNLSISTLNKADRIVVYDSYTKNIISESIDPGKIIIIPPCLDVNLFHPKSKLTKKNMLNIISVGTLNKRKQFDILIIAFSKINFMKTNVTLTIVGEGPERGNLEKLIKSLNLEHKILLTGFQENSLLPSLYRKADIFALIQEQESFGQVYIEAMASGLPIVTSKNIGSTQIIKPDFGILVKYNDLDAIATAMENLLSNDSKRKIYSKNARKEAVDKYSIESSAFEYIKLYKSII